MLHPDKEITEEMAAFDRLTIWGYAEMVRHEEWWRSERQSLRSKNPDAAAEKEESRRRGAYNRAVQKVHRLEEKLSELTQELAQAMSEADALSEPLSGGIVHASRAWLG